MPIVQTSLWRQLAKQLPSSESEVDLQVRPPVHLVSEDHGKSNRHNLDNVDDRVDSEWLTNTDRLGKDDSVPDMRS
jgi:hypothetical protein